MRAVTLTALLAVALGSAAPGLAACAPAGGPSARAVDPALWADPPDCVVVLPAERAAQVAVTAVAVTALEVEEAVARHLSSRVDRVIGPRRRAALVGRLGLDLRHPGDRRRLAGLAGCRHAAVARLWGGRAWGVVWTETRVGLDLAILGLADGRVLWQGRGTGRRGDGGLPLSPVSAVVAAGLAARAALGRDAVASVLDDALRSVLRELPDFRDPQAFASRNSSVSPLSSRK